MVEMEPRMQDCRIGDCYWPLGMVQRMVVRTNLLAQRGLNKVALSFVVDPGHWSLALI